MEIWIFTALAAALFSSAKSLIQKHLTEDYGSLEIAYISSILGVFFLAPVGVYGYTQAGLPHDLLAWTGLFISGIGNIIGIYMYITALSITDISIVSPLRRATPVFTSLLEPLILGTAYSLNIIGGAILAFLGSYIVLAKDGLTKIPQLGKGALIAVSLPVLYSVVVIAERYATQQMSPFLFSFLIYVLLSIFYSVLVTKKGKRVGKEKFNNPVIIGIGLAAALGSVSIFYSLSIASASQVTVVKQSVILFNVIIGGRIFREEGILRKLIGALIIVSGILLVI